VIFYLFLVNIIGNCHENKYIWILWCVRVKSPQKINNIKKNDVPDLHRSLHRIRFYLELRLQFRQHDPCI
jgi:hypothetical protein